MQMKTQELINFFQSNGGVTRFSAILKAGFHSDSLIILEKEKKVEKIARGGTLPAERLCSRVLS
jgi:hypothetical protein